VLPAEWGDVGEERVGNDLASAAQGIESATEIYGVPQSDRRGDQEVSRNLGDWEGGASRLSSCALVRAVSAWRIVPVEV